MDQSALPDLQVFLGIAAAAMAIAFGLLFYLRSRHPFLRVPLWRVLLFFVYGAIGAPVAVYLVYLVFKLTKLDFGDVAGAFILTGPIEEGVKFAGPLVLVGLVRRWRLEPFEWILAGAAAGTGFAMTENILYAVASPESFQILALRSLAPMHLLWSGWLGYRIGRRTPGTRGLIRSALQGFLIAAFLHGLWDALCFTGYLGVLFLLFGGQLLAFGWHVRKMAWLCANRSPRRPEPAADAESTPVSPAPDFICPSCAAPYVRQSLRGVEVAVCPGCNRVIVGRGDLFRFVNGYAGTTGWSTPDAWYSFYWLDPDPDGGIPCPGCGQPAPLRRFLHHEGPQIGFCRDCALAVGDRNVLFKLVELFRTRIENGFLYS